jgi:vacuolar-type H+-ATPase subunit I/STV1
MTTARTIVRIEKLTWILAYGGLFLLILGLATSRLDAVTGWVLVALGAVIAVAGFVLIPIRARMHASPDNGAQSTPTKTETE